MKPGFALFALTKALTFIFKILLITAIPTALILRFYIAINLCGLHHTCFDSKPQLLTVHALTVNHNAHWIIKQSQPTLSAGLNEANVNILSNVTVKEIFYIKVSILDHHSL